MPSLPRHPASLPASARALVEGINASHAMCWRPLRNALPACVLLWHAFPSVRTAAQVESIAGEAAIT